MFAGIYTNVFPTSPAPLFVPVIEKSLGVESVLRLNLYVFPDSNNKVLAANCSIATYAPSSVTSKFTTKLPSSCIKCLVLVESPCIVSNIFISLPLSSTSIS